jgi:hypothetical protein
MSLAKEFIEARNIKIPIDVKQLTKIMDDYASMMVHLEQTEVSANKTLTIKNKTKMEKVTFEQAVKPLMKWLSENTHPHTTAIVTGNLAELVEGVESVKTDEFIVD